MVGSFLVVEFNILIVATTGNFGHSKETIKNTAPWILTVGGSLSKRHFITSLSIDDLQYEIIVSFLTLFRCITTSISQIIWTVYKISLFPFAL